METDCPSLEPLANSKGLTLSSNSTLSGDVVGFTCTQENQRVDGLSHLICRNGTWSSELPLCTGDDELTEREIIIIVSCSAALGVVLIVLLVLTICLLCARRRRIYKRSQRLQEKLQTWSMRDPLEEIVYRETKRQATNETYKPTVITKLSHRPDSHLYKIWNNNRTKKKFAFAASISELFQIASDSLNIRNPHKVVLEEDGTEISSDEILQACAESVLLILEPGEEWVPSFIIKTNQISVPDTHRNSSIRFVNDLYNISSSLNNGGYNLGDGHRNEGYETISDDVKVGL